MKQEVEHIPITRDNILAIAGLVRTIPRSPVVVPVSYGQVSVPGAFAECIDGVLQDPEVVYLSGMNAPVGPSHFDVDEDGHVYNAHATGITVQSLLTAVKETTKSIWTLQLNLADPSMPDKLRGLHRLTPMIGLVAIVTPQATHEYLERFSEFAPVLFRPDRT